MRAATRPRALVLHLRSHRSGILGQGVRFAVAGGTVSGVYLASTLILADVVGVAFQVALLCGFSLGLLVHFTLQRTFVWVHSGDFALALHEQALRYLAAAGAQYGLTAASTAVLPGVLGVPTEVVYVLTVIVIVSTNFFVFRHGIFHSASSETHTA